MLTRRHFLTTTGLAGGGLLLGLSQDDKKKLKITPSNIEGPFYRKDAPFRGTLAEKVKGDPLTITGKVLAPDGTPLKEAIVDVWHADDDGDYDNKSKKFLLRGRIRTDKKGLYTYETIMPGQYDQGESKRPAHVHYKVSTKGYKSLTTQLYFKGDEFLKKDPWALKELTIELKTKEKKSSGTFDIVLAKA